MSKFISRLGFLAAFFCFAATLLAIDVPLEFVKYPEKQETYFPSGLAGARKALDPP